MLCRFSERGVSSKSFTPCYFHAGCLALPELTHVKAVVQFAPAFFGQVTATSLRACCLVAAPSLPHWA